MAEQFQLDAELLAALERAGDNAVAVVQFLGLTVEEIETFASDYELSPAERRALGKLAAAAYSLQAERNGATEQEKRRLVGAGLTKAESIRVKAPRVKIRRYTTIHIEEWTRPADAQGVRVDVEDFDSVTTREEVVELETPAVRVRVEV